MDSLLKIWGITLIGLFSILLANGQTIENQASRGAESFFTLSGVVFKGSFTLDSVRVFLYREQVPGHAERIDSVISYGENGAYKFENLIAGTYYVQARMVSALAHDYFDTYYGNRVQWKESTALVINGDMHFKDINLQHKANSSTGSGRVSGDMTYGSGVVNHLEGEQASDVQVLILNDQQEVIAQTYSNQQGHFEFASLPLVSVDLIVDYPGKAMSTVTLELNSSNTTMENLKFVIGSESVNVLDALGEPEFSTNDHKKWKVFPNPVKDRFFLQGEGDVNWITLRNAQGAEVLKAPYDGEFGVSVGHLPDGMYYVELKNANGIRTIPLVVK